MGTPETVWKASELVFKAPSNDFKLGVEVMGPQKGARPFVAGRCEVSCQDLSLDRPGQWHKVKRALQLKESDAGNRGELEFEVWFDPWGGALPPTGAALSTASTDQLQVAHENLKAVLERADELRGTEGERAAQELNRLTMQIVQQLQPESGRSALASPPSLFGMGSDGLRQQSQHPPPPLPPPDTPPPGPDRLFGSIL